MFNKDSYHIAKTMAFASNCSLIKWLANLFTFTCLFANMSAITPGAKDHGSIMVTINSKLSNASSLMCQSESCRSFVHAAVKCYRKRDCLSLYFNGADMSCLLCTCPVDPSVFNRHVLTVQEALHVIDKPRLAKGMENYKTVYYIQLCNIYAHFMNIFVNSLKYAK